MKISYFPCVNNLRLLYNCAIILLLLIVPVYSNLNDTTTTVQTSFLERNQTSTLNTNETNDTTTTTSNRQRRMINGNLVSIETFPWTVLIISSRGRCGGSLIDANWILTAAHCITNNNNNNGQMPIVYFGIDRQSSASLRNKRYVIEVLKPKKNPFLTNDVALLRLDHPIPLTPRSVPIKLNDNRKLVLHQMGVVAGFGRNNLQTDHLLAARFQIVPAFLISTRDVLGARSTRQSPCYGDSGSGLIVELSNNEPYLAGVTSSILAAGCQPNHLALFSDVSYYYAWIKHHIERDISSSPSSSSSFSPSRPSTQSESSSSPSTKTSPEENCWPIILPLDFKFTFCNYWF